MKHKLATLMMLVGLQTAQAYQVEIKARNESDAREYCLALLGPDAKLTHIQHITTKKPGMVDFIIFKSVKADCIERNVSDWAAAELFAKAAGSQNMAIVEVAISELNKLEIYSESILKNTVDAIGLSQVFLADYLMGFISDAGRKAVPFVQPLLNDPDATIRYKAAHTFWLMAFGEDKDALDPVLADLERLYFAEYLEDSFLDPYPMGIKINVAATFGLLPGKAPRSLVDKMVSDLTDIEITYDQVNTSYEGPMTLGATLVRTLAKIGEPAVPFLADALLENDGGPFMNGESFPLLAAEAIGAKAKDLLPTLQQILAQGKTPYPKRIQLAIDRISGTLHSDASHSSQTIP